MDWINVKTELPKENGQYLCVIKYTCGMGHHIDILGFHNNLKQLDKYDFPKKKTGFYNYDSEWGYSDWTDQVLYWMPLPEMPSELAGEK